RLRQRLPTGGLTMFIQGWKHKVTPSGRRYCQLVASVRPIDATACGLWPTPRKQMATGTWEGRSTKVGPDLQTAVMMAMWTTPSSRDWKDTPGMATTGNNPDGTQRERNDQLPRQ